MQLSMDFEKLKNNLRTSLGALAVQFVWFELQSYSNLGNRLAYNVAQGVLLVAMVMIPSTVMMTGKPLNLSAVFANQNCFKNHWCLLPTDLIRLTQQLKFLVTCPGDESPGGFLASRRRLIRVSLIFIIVFILLGIPAGVSGFLYRLPPGLDISASLHGVVESLEKVLGSFPYGPNGYESFQARTQKGGASRT